MDEQQLREIPVDANKVIDDLLKQLSQKTLNEATLKAILSEKETIIQAQAQELAEFKKEA